MGQSSRWDAIVTAHIERRWRAAGADYPRKGGSTAARTDTARSRRPKRSLPRRLLGQHVAEDVVLAELTVGLPVSLEHVVDGAPDGLIAGDAGDLL